MVDPRLKFISSETKVTMGMSEERDTTSFYYFDTVEDAARSLLRGVEDVNEIAAIEADIERESQRLAIAEQLGDMVTYRALRTEKRVHKRRPGQFKPTRYSANLALDVSYKGPLLGAALLYGAPQQLTDFDTERLNDFGFENVDQLTDTILAWNVRGKIPHIPLPYGHNKS